MIFVSYSWADSAFARNIVRQLSEQGHQVWIDYQNLNLDEALAPQLALAIRAADIVLVISSPSAWLSRWVQFELLLAQSWCKTIHIIRAPLEAYDFSFQEGTCKQRDMKISIMLPQETPYSTVERLSACCPRGIFLSDYQTDLM